MATGGDTLGGAIFSLDSAGFGSKGDFLTAAIELEVGSALDWPGEGLG